MFRTNPGVTNRVVVGGANLLPSYLNNGTVINPQIDAVTFINDGTFEAVDILPFETSSTLNFTNNGTMIAAVGFLLDDSPAGAGSRRPSANFFNGNSGVIEALDASSLGSTLQNVPTVVFPSYVLVHAANLVNQGQLVVGANGLLQLTGSRVTLSHSTLVVTPLSDESQGSSTTAGTNTFFPDIGIYDLYWGATNYDANDTLDTAAIWDGLSASAPGAPAAPAAAPPIHINNPLSDSYINILGISAVTITNSDGSTSSVTLITNLTKGAVFVGYPAGFSPRVGFTPGISNFNTIGVLISAPVTNAVTGIVGQNTIYFRDTLASAGGEGLLMNELTGNTFRPTNYFVDRSATRPGNGGNNGYPEPNFFLDSDNFGVTNVSLDLVTNPIVSSGLFSDYSPYIDDVVSRPPTVVGGTITNLPGSIWITAKTLDLTGTRMTAVGQVSIKASHLISSTNAVIDCENLSFDLGSTNGRLEFQNLANTSLGRLRGPMRAWSATWASTINVVIDNNYTSNANTGTWDPLPLTNAANVGFDVLILDASELKLSLPVYVYSLALHSTHIDENDDMTVLTSLLIDGTSLTLNGSLNIPGVLPAGNPITQTASPAIPLTDWVATNAPKLLYFTNNGSLSIPNEGHFGDDRKPYAAIVNAGALAAGGLAIRSGYFENDGSLIALSAGLSIQCGTGNFQHGSSSSGNFSRFTAGNLKFYKFSLSAGDSLTFIVTNSLTDAGPGSGNTIQVQNGFNLLTLPATGDLLGTSLQTSDPSLTGRFITHTWAGADRGPTPAGYTNNEAVGQLLFTTQDKSSVFSFQGTGTHNALYVDRLDLSAFGSNYLTQLSINPNLVIYYAAATNNYAAPATNGVPQEWEEFLDGQFGGHLRWVRDFAGPNSSTAVIVTNASGPQSVMVNTALRNSKIIDSNGDGIPNGDEGYPLTAPPFSVVTAAVHVSGNGSVAPNYNGQLLLAGLSYSMTALPSKDAKFSGWTGSVHTTAPQLTFVATNGLDFVANFTFPTSASYSGLFSEPSGAEFLKSGAVSLTTTKGGGYTGTLRIGANRYSISGKFDANNSNSRSVGPYHLQLLLSNDRITGTVSGSDWSADLQANRRVFNGTTSQAPFAGRYTVLFPGVGDPNETEFPLGNGYGAVTVNKSGTVQLNGILADGTVVSQTATLSADGQWPLFTPLYNGTGQILGWVSFASTTGSDLSGIVTWHKPPNAAAAFYPNGFDFGTNAFGSAYSPAVTPAIGFLNGELVLTGGNLASPIDGLWTIRNNNTAIPADGGNGSLRFTPAQGFFNGSVPIAGTGKPARFNGVILQKQGYAAGYFRGTNQIGSAILGPAQ